MNSQRDSCVLSNHECLGRISARGPRKGFQLGTNPRVRYSSDCPPRPTLRCSSDTPSGQTKTQCSLLFAASEHNTNNRRGSWMVGQALLYVFHWKDFIDSFQVYEIGIITHISQLKKYSRRGKVTFPSHTATKQKLLSKDLKKILVGGKVRKSERSEQTVFPAGETQNSLLNKKRKKVFPEWKCLHELRIPKDSPDT